MQGPGPSIQVKRWLLKGAQGGADTREVFVAQQQGFDKRGREDSEKDMPKLARKAVT